MNQQLAALQSLSGLPAPLLFLVVAWSLVWKGIALWKAARIGHKWWFVFLFVVNLFGIPEIFYIFLIARKFKVESNEEDQQK